MKQNKSDAIIFNSAFVPYQMVQNILNPDLICSTLSFRQELLGKLHDRDFLSQAMIYEIKTYLVSSLNRLDKMNMALGLETATPFLDNDFFQYALRIPKNHKIKLLNNKYILRKMALNYLPSENLGMPKSGFGVPTCIWFRADGNLGMMLQELRGDGLIREVFSRPKVMELIDQHLNGEKEDYSEILWLITNLCLWHRQFFR